MDQNEMVYSQGGQVPMHQQQMYDSWQQQQMIINEINEHQQNDKSITSDNLQNSRQNYTESPPN